MDTLVINAKSNSNARFILELAKKLGETGKLLSKSDQEDFLMGHIMLSEKTGKTIGREAIMKKLKEK